MIQSTIDMANTDRNVARLLESFKDGYADKLIAGGLGFKYVYRNNNSRKYLFSIYYEDISGNQYEQLYPVEIVEENNKKYKRIDTNGQQCLTGRAK